MPITYRPITLDEFDQFDFAVMRGFSAHPESNPWFKDFASRAFEPEQSVVAFDGDQMVGTSSSLTFEISVPGANTLPAGGITDVTVFPTHRRRGIRTGMAWPSRTSTGRSTCGTRLSPTALKSEDR
jgi:hypothetical protein